MSAIRIALWALLAVAIAVIGATVALPLYLDTHKDLLAAAASRALGRDVRIDGAVGVAWLPRPSLHLQNVQMTGYGEAGASEGSAAPLPWRAGRLEAELDFAALFARSLRITRILVHEALIDLDIGTLKALPGARASSSPNRFGFAIDNLVFAESTLVLQGSSGAPLIVGIDRVAVIGFGSPTLAVDGEVTLYGIPVSFSASTGPAGRTDVNIAATVGEASMTGDLSLLSGGIRPRVEGRMTLAKLDLRSSGGTFNRPAAMAAATNAWLDVALPVAGLRALDLELVLDVADLDAMHLRIDRLATRLRLDAGLLRLDGLSAELSDMRLLGEAMLDVRADRPIWSADLTTKGIEWGNGRLDVLSLSARTSGTSARELIESLDAELKADKAQLQGATKGKGKDKGATPPVQFTQPLLSVTPGAAVRLHTAATAGGQTFDLDLTGGALIDLVGDAPAWPQLDVVVRQGAGRDRLAIRGRIGPLAALVAGRQLDVDLSLQQSGLDIGATGTLARLDAFDGSRLDVEAAIKDLTALDGAVSGTLAGWLPDGLRDSLAAGLPRGLPLRVSSRVLGLDRGLELADLKIASADSDLGGTLTIRFAPRLRVQGTLVSQRMDLTPYLAISQSAAEAARAAPERTPLPAIPEQLDGTLGLKIGHLRAGDLGLDLVELDAALDSGHLRAGLAAGAERPGVRLDLQPERSGSGSAQTGWRFDIQTRGDLNLALLLETRDVGLQSPIHATLDARFTGLATEMEDPLGHADGHLDVSFGSGQLHKRAAGLLPLGGLLVSLLDVLSPLNVRAQVADLQCAVMQFDVTDGIATSTQGLALQTREINAIGGGAINLRTEEIELRFKTTQRRGLGISLLGIADRFVYVRGTLRDPKAGIDATALLVQGGAAWATSGISLVADQLFRRLTATANPCDAVRRQR